MDVGTLDAAERCVDSIETTFSVLGRGDVIYGRDMDRGMMSKEEVDLLVRLARDGIDAGRRTRKREVLLAEVLTVLNATDISPAIVDTVAERILTKLGVALLVDGEPTDTSTIRSGEKQTMTVEEFLRREGGGAA